MNSLNRRPPSSKEEKEPAESSNGGGGVGNSINNDGHQEEDEVKQIKQQMAYNNSMAIRQEIQRFESVHPSIYAVYDLLELINEPLITQQIREHVVCIEDSFVNSQEWTLSRAVPDLRLGIVGSVTSGKSALVHRYLTGSYMHDESPEGGRFKKEITIDCQSYMLLIRDEGGPPEMQFSCWVDAIILVFNLTDETSLNAAYTYYCKISNYRNNTDIPVVLVGTQESVSDSKSKAIEDVKIKKIASEIKRCSYFETCATYGFNVERVFQEACQKIINSRKQPSETINYSSLTTPRMSTITSNVAKQINKLNSTLNPTKITTTTTNNILNTINNNKNSNGDMKSPLHLINSNTKQKATTISYKKSEFDTPTTTPIAHQKMDSCPVPPVRVSSRIDSLNAVNARSEYSTPEPQLREHNYQWQQQQQQQGQMYKDLPTPTSTPNTARKTRRRSNLFPQLTSNKHRTLEEKSRNGELGIGRVIPIRQGYLYKKSGKPLNKEWKKKYVTLTADGYITYHPSLHDYMDNKSGKNIPLKHTTVKIPGQKPRGTRVSNINGSLPGYYSQKSEELDKDLSSITIDTERTPTTLNTQNGKKEKKSEGKKSRTRKSDAFEEPDGYEFVIVSLDNKQWRFEAGNSEERDAWISAIEEQILNSLQELQSDKAYYRNSTTNADKATIQTIRTVAGNGKCVDCDAPNPVWASLNLGALICIECSGIHRNLGTHISRVRSLELDDWPTSHVSVMMALGNANVNKLWEFNTKTRRKPGVNSNRDEKELWIRSKYEKKEFLKPLLDSSRIELQLLDAVISNDVLSVASVLAHTSPNEHINWSFYLNDKRPPVHIAADNGSLAIIQLLIWYNTDVKVADSNGYTPLYYARQKDHKEIENLLLQNGCTEIGSSSPIRNDNLLNRRRESITLKASEVFDKLHATII